MAIPGGELKADTHIAPAAEMADPSTGTERILDADEIAAELVFEAPAPPSPRRPPTNRPASPPRAATTHRPITGPQPTAAVARQPTSGPPPTTAGSRQTGSGPPATAAGSRQTSSGPPPTAAARLATAETELTRLRTQMRARDAYLAELEHALEASTSKLEASGIGSIEDAHKLLGRVRGQAFRIAELESELRSLELRLSRMSRLLPAGYNA